MRAFHQAANMSYPGDGKEDDDEPSQDSLESSHSVDRSQLTDLNSDAAADNPMWKRLAGSAARGSDDPRDGASDEDEDRGYRFSRQVYLIGV